MSGQLTWSHYLELLKCDDPLEMQFYMKECINEGWKVRELRRQINSSLFQRLALSSDKEGVLALANEGHQVQSAADIIRDPFVLEFTGLPRQRRYISFYPPSPFGKATGWRAPLGKEGSGGGSHLPSSFIPQLWLISWLVFKLILSSLEVRKATGRRALLGNG